MSPVKDILAIPIRHCFPIIHKSARSKLLDYSSTPIVIDSEKYFTA